MVPRGWGSVFKVVFRLRGCFCSIFTDRRVGFKRFWAFIYVSGVLILCTGVWVLCTPGMVAHMILCTGMWVLSDFIVRGLNFCAQACGF